MSFDSNVNKWKPLTVAQEIPNYFTSYCNIAVVTMVNVGGFIPVFASTTGYVTSLVGDFATATTSTRLTINRTGLYIINMIAQGSVNQSNPRMYKNGSLLVYGTQTQSNNSGGINVIL
jgi:hypothetical protein